VSFDHALGHQNFYILLNKKLTDNVNHEEDGALAGPHGEIAAVLVAVDRVARGSLD